MMSLRERSREKGVTLIELLVALVIGSLLAIAIFQFFLSSSQTVTNQSSTTQLFQRGRNALAILRQSVESSGFGLPSVSDCPNGIAAYNSNQSTAVLSLTAVTASTQSSGAYSPAIGTYTVTTVSGGASFGNAPLTQITSIPSTSSQRVFLTSTNLIEDGDMFIVQIPGQACLMAQVTNTEVNGGAIGIVHNSGRSVYNPSGGFKTLADALYPGLSTKDFAGANFIDLGNNQFTINVFSIGDDQGSGTPTLYLTQYAANNTPPARQALARGVVDLQIEYGVGSNGAISKWMFPETYTPTVGQEILAVRIVMLVRSTRYMPNETSPATIPVLGGRTYSVPTSGGPGCLQGNCQHYAYHLFDTVVPVRNHIWGGQ